MEYPLTLYFDTEVTDVEIKDSSHGDSDFRKAYIVNDGMSKIVNANQELKMKKGVEKRRNIAENVRCETNKTHNAILHRL